MRLSLRVCVGACVCLRLRVRSRLLVHPSFDVCPGLQVLPELRVAHSFHRRHTLLRLRLFSIALNTSLDNDWLPFVQVYHLKSFARGGSAVSYWAAGEKYSYRNARCKLYAVTRPIVLGLLFLPVEMRPMNGWIFEGSKEKAAFRKH